MIRLLLFFLILPNLLFSEVYTYLVVSDFYVDSYNINYHGGPYESLRVGSHGIWSPGNVYRSFFTFDTYNDIPRNAVINSVTLKLYTQQDINLAIDRPAWAVDWDPYLELYSVTSPIYSGRDLEVPMSGWETQPIRNNILAIVRPPKPYYRVLDGEEISFRTSGLKNYVQERVRDEEPIHLGLKFLNEVNNSLSYHVNYFNFYDSSVSDTILGYNTPRIVIDWSYDTTPPTINLIGSSSITLSLGSTYEDPGVTASDNVDGDITNNISMSGNVNTNAPGSYILSYSVTDSSGNTSTAFRVITYEVSPYLSFALNDDGVSYSLTDCSYQASGELTIPILFNGLPVTSIGSYAFQYCRGLISITIPDSVTSIGSYAFRSCRGLISITIPDSVTSIGDGLFFYCTSLTSVTFEGNAPTSGSYQFYNTPGVVYYYDGASGFTPNWRNKSTKVISHTLFTASIEARDTEINLSFNAAPSQSYRIESSTNLKNWNTIDHVINGSGNTIIKSYDIDSTQDQFYRIKSFD